MDVVKRKGFGEQQDFQSKEVDPKDLLEQTHIDRIDGGALPKKRKARHRKFIDLQKLPPKPKPLVQE